MLSPAGGLIQTSQGAAVDTSNPIKIQHNRVVLDADDPFETQSNGKLGAKLESPVALYNGKIAVYHKPPLHNENNHLTVLYNWPIEVGVNGGFYLKYHYPLNIDGSGFLYVGLNADSLQEKNHNLEPVPTTYSYVGGTVMHNAPVSVRDFKTNGLTVNVKSDTEIEYTVDSRYLEIEGTLKTLRDIRTSTYQICSIEGKQFEQPNFTNDYVNGLLLLEIYIENIVEKGRSNFSPFPQYFVT